MLDVTVVGETVADLILTVPKKYLRGRVEAASLELPFGQKISLDGYAFLPGGSGANVATGLSRLGLSVKLISPISNDHLAEMLKESIVAERVDLQPIETDRPTPVSAVIQTGVDHTVLTYHNQLISPKTIEIKDGRWVYLAPLNEGGTKIIEGVVSQKINRDFKICINPSRYMIEERDRALMTAIRGSEVLVVNKHEAQLLTGSSVHASNDELIGSLLRLGPKVVCLTLGDKGAYAATAGLKIFSRALTDADQAVNTIGAGDAFSSGFLAGLMRSETLEDKEALGVALKTAMLNSGRVVEESGAQKALQTWEEIEREMDTVKLVVDG